MSQIEFIESTGDDPFKREEENEKDKNYRFHIYSMWEIEHGLNR